MNPVIITIIFCLIAGCYDVRWRRIPNLLVLVGLATAVIWQAVTGGSAGLLFALKGWVLGMALLMIPFVMRGMGAGDVKLLGVVGALQGWVFVVNTFLWMAVWGGHHGFHSPRGQR